MKKFLSTIIISFVLIVSCARVQKPFVSLDRSSLISIDDYSIQSEDNDIDKTQTV